MAHPGDFLNNNVIALFLKQEQELGPKDCLRYSSKGKWSSLSWSEVKSRVMKLASGLESLGVKKGDRVAILSNTRYEWTLADLAILSLGAVTVPIYQSTLPKDIEFILNHSESRVVFVEDPGLQKKVEDVRKGLPNLKEIVVFERAQGNGVQAFRKLMQESPPMSKTSKRRFSPFNRTIWQPSFTRAAPRASPRVPC